MKKSRYTEEQIAFALNQAEIGVSVGEICRKMGIAESTFYHWKKKFSGLGITELRRLSWRPDRFYESERKTNCQPTSSVV